MRRKTPLYFFLLFTLFFLLIPGASSAAHVYSLHKGPGVKFPVVGRVRTSEKVKILKEEAGWVKIRTRHGKQGWISQNSYRRGWRQGKAKGKPDRVKLTVKFQNIPKDCVKMMTDTLGELRKRLPPVGDDTLELVVSALPRLRSYRLFLLIDFNPKFYRRTMKWFSRPSTIDLLPFNGCIWALHAYKEALIRKANAQAHDCCGFMKRLSINLILRRLNGEEVVLETVEEGVYIYFSPSLVLREPDGVSFRIVSEEPKKVGLLSAFALPYPLSNGGGNASHAMKVYRFFRARP